jgi:hypothetical protein
MSDIATIFCKDPEAMTTDDIDRIVAKYQEMRLNPHLFNPKTGELKPPKRVRRKASRQIEMDLAPEEKAS